MLRIYAQTSASDVKNYFAVADYYTEGQETVGKWSGKLAERLGLTGRVTKEAFDLLCDNRDPRTGEALTPRTNSERRVGYDFVFSGPKSFSILEGLAPEEERTHLVRDFDDAVAETMREIEDDMHCRVRVNGADYDRRTGNLASATFGHSTSRPVDDQPPDMHRHTHVFVFNATEDSQEGRIKAGEFSYIKRDGEYYTAVFYAHLAKRLQDRGYVIDRRGGKEWEVAGVPQPLIDTFSKRTDQVEAEHRERMANDPAYREEYKYELAAKTRSRKQKELTPAQLRAAWDAQLSDAQRDVLGTVYATGVAAGVDVTASAAVAYAIHHCFERESVVAERELVRVALLQGLGTLTAGQVRAELPAQGVLLAEKDDRLMATTQEVHGQEHFLTNFAKNGLGTVEAVGVASSLSRALPDGNSLDDDQWNTVTGLLSSCDRIQLVDAAAGVGKSTMLRVYDDGMKLAGNSVTYLATTTPAVGVLREDGFAAETVAKFLLSNKMQAAAKGGYLVVDESSMMGLRDAFRLFTIAKEENIKLVFLGDSRQHSSVSAGAFMRLMQEYGGVTPHRISEIKRQKNKHHKAAVQLMFEGKTLKGFDVLDKKLGWVKEIIDDGERYRAMATEYVDALKAGTKWNQLLLLSPTHAEGERVTGAVRALLREEKMLGADDHEFTRWVSSDLSEAERGQEVNYRPGRVDMVQFHQNATGHKSGSRVMIDKDALPSLPLDEAKKFQTYRKDTVKFAEGDIVRFTAGGTTADGHQIRNGSVYKIAGFTPAAIKLDNGWLVGNDFGHFKHGIETSLGSQSKTVAHAIVGQSSDSFGASNREQAYVSASRAKYRVTVFTDDKDGLRRAIERSSLKMAAHDLIKPQPPPRSTSESWWDRRRRQALLKRTRKAGDEKRPYSTPPHTPPSHGERVRYYESEHAHGR